MTKPIDPTSTPHHSVVKIPTLEQLKLVGDALKMTSVSAASIAGIGVHPLHNEVISLIQSINQSVADQKGALETGITFTGIRQSGNESNLPLPPKPLSTDRGNGIV